MPMDEFSGFVANRTQNHYRKKSAQSRTLKYDKCTEEMKAKLSKTRSAECGKWTDFDATENIPDQQAENLIAEGHQVVDTSGWRQTRTSI